MLPQKKHNRRSKKYSNIEKARKANIENTLRYQEKKALQPSDPIDFIVYKPSLHSDIPTNTPPTINLRTDIQIPQDHQILQDHDTQESDVPETLRSTFPLLTQLPSIDKNADIAVQIKQIQKNEQEVNLERNEYNTEIAEILIGLRSAYTTSTIEETRIDGISETYIEGAIEVGISGIQTMEDLYIVNQKEGVHNEELWRSCSSHIGSIDELIMIWDNDSIVISNPSNEPASIQRSPMNIMPPETPTQSKSFPLSLSSNRTSNKGSTSRQSTSFPIQKNNLLS
ncbi:hypothetical protein OCU04_000002 [Sclerotinia nivalis]|uniref:Uncharacterized protein n=1 Tax=Sclerotinia nivalis TaxID=352851 RepID=A0A9X0AV80_9HELO|nr:hypothetical protein OCU04_000002 [Sclerotinia nivalis]